MMTLPPKTLDLLNKYLHLPFKNKRIACPYWVNDLDKGIKGPFSGKGTPGQIVYASYKRAKKRDVDLDRLNRKELLNFLSENRIGVDCSGFVFHLLNQLDKERGGEGIANKYLDGEDIPGWRAAWKINADKLTSDKFTTQITLKEVEPGDIIRLLKGRHVALIVKVSNKSITYAHSSNYTTQTGCHLRKIFVDDWKKGIEDQNWQEVTKKGENYNNVTYFPSAGDSIRRLRW